MVVRRVAVLALLVALAGCQEESADPPSPKPSPTVTESPTESPSAPAEPDMPAAAKEPTQAGAEAFVRYYWDLVNYAQATGDTKRLRSVSAATCVQCDGGIDAIDDVYGRDGRIVGGRYVVDRLEASKLESSVPRFRLTYALANTSQVIDLPGSADDGSLHASTNEIEMFVDYLDDAWSVSVWGKAA